MKTKKQKIKKNPKYKLVNIGKKFPEVEVNLNPGDYAKLIFNGKPREKMWVKVKSKSGKNYKGSLENSPLYLKGVKYKDVILFKPENVLLVIRKRK